MYEETTTLKLATNGRISCKSQASLHLKAVVSLPKMLKPVTMLDEVGKRNNILQTAKPTGLPGVIFCCVCVEGST